MANVETHNYMLTVVHMSEGVLIKTFETVEDAMAAASLLSPETNGKILPNVPSDLIDEDHYVKGMFWFGNRYAAIHKIRK